jgi:hypothetical protein
MWLVPPGTALEDPPSRGILVNTNPPATENRITRYRGYFTAPASGEFQFWLATPGNHAPAVLRLSTDEYPAHKQTIAQVTPRALVPGNDVGKRPRAPIRTAPNFLEERSQKSLPQKLTAGHRYYFELLEEGAEGETAVVGWRLPNEPVNSKIVPMDQTCLSPFNQPAGAAGR